MTELENIIMLLTIILYLTGGLGFLYYWFIYRPKWFMEVIRWSEWAEYEHSDYKKAKAYFDKRGELRHE